MHHSFIDQHSNLNSVIHKLDPRVKIVAFFSFILFVILTPPLEFIKFLLYFLLIFSIILMSKVPLSFIFKRSLIIIPFVLLIAMFVPFLKEGNIIGSYNIGPLELAVTYDGMSTLFNILIKSWLSILSMITLISTTKFPQLLKGFEKLKLPKIFIMIMSFMYRYLFILIDELVRLRMAMEARSFHNNGLLWNMKIAGNIIGILFIRSYERAERVYYALLSRGFTGDINTINNLNIKTSDIVFFFLFFIFIIVVFL